MPPKTLRHFTGMNLPTSPDVLITYRFPLSNWSGFTSWAPVSFARPITSPRSLSIVTASDVRGSNPTSCGPLAATTVPLNVLHFHTTLPEVESYAVNSQSQFFDGLLARSAALEYEEEQDVALAA